jgi:hypothetical protein
MTSSLSTMSVFLCAPLLLLAAWASIRRPRAVAGYASNDRVGAFAAYAFRLRRLAACLTWILVAATAFAQEPANPLKPVDRSSPRATLKTFLDGSDALGAFLAQDYLPSPSRERFGRLISLSRDTPAEPGFERSAAGGAPEDGPVLRHWPCTRFEPHPAAAC